MMASWSARLGLIAGLCCLLGAPLGAQTPRTGWWVGMGAGMSRFELDCRSCVDKVSEDMATGTFSLGLRPWSPIALSFEASGLFGTGGTVTEREGSLLATAKLYPLPKVPVFLEAGAGWSHYRTAFGADAAAPLWRSSGSARLFGIGANFVIRPQLSIVPRLNVLTTDRATLSTREATSSAIEQSYKVTTFSVGLLYRIHAR